MTCRFRLCRFVNASRSRCIGCLSRCRRQKPLWPRPAGHLSLTLGYLVREGGVVLASRVTDCALKYKPFFVLHSNHLKSFSVSHCIGLELLACSVRTTFITLLLNRSCVLDLGVPSFLLLYYKSFTFKLLNDRLYQLSPSTSQHPALAFYKTCNQ